MQNAGSSKENKNQTYLKISSQSFILNVALADTVDIQEGRIYIESNNTEGKVP